MDKELALLTSFQTCIHKECAHRTCISSRLTAATEARADRAVLVRAPDSKQEDPGSNPIGAIY